MIKKESQNFLDGERWGTGQREITDTHKKRSIKDRLPPFTILPSREWVAARGRKWRHHRSRKGGPFESWQVAKERRRRESTTWLNLFFFARIFFFFPSNLLASWQTIPKTFLLAANSQRNEVVEFKLSRGLYMYINSFSLLPSSFIKSKMVFKPPQKEKSFTLVQG